MIDRMRIVLVGVGGQGVLSAARLLGDAAIAADLEVTLGQHHGMSQRGGSVESSVIIGPARTSLVGRGQADLLLGFEPMEALRAISLVSERTLIAVNRDRVSTFSMTREGQPYPDLAPLFQQLRAAAKHVVVADVAGLAREAGDSRVGGVIMLGWAAGLGALPFDGEALRAIIEQRYEGAVLRVNRRALALGMELGRAASSWDAARELATT